MANQVLFTIRSQTPEEFSQKHSEMSAIAARDSVFLPAEKPPVVVPDTQDKEPPAPPRAPARTPWFQVGEGEGSPGETVEVPVFAGCVRRINGFHIGGGCGLMAGIKRSGYGKLIATGATLGSYLSDYLEAQGAGDKYFSKFNFVNSDNRALPEEWWEYAVGFFSTSKKLSIEPVPIPSGTELFRVTFKIPDNANSGELVLTCKDEYYYTHYHQRRRDFTWTYEPQGFTAIECFPGKFVIK